MTETNETAAKQSYSVFITAANTGLGLAVTGELVARGHTVTGVVKGLHDATLLRQVGGLPVYSNPTRAGELRSVINMSKADVVVHLAPQSYNTIPHRESEWNTDAIHAETIAIVNAAKASSVKFLVHTSYAGVYGHATNADETHATSASAIHAYQAALDSEQVVRGIPAVILRAGVVYGPGDASTKALHDGLFKGATVLPSDSHAAMNWVYVDDLAQAVALAVEHQPAGEVFNVVDDQAAPYSEFVDHFASAIGMPHTPNRMNGFMAKRTLSKTLQALLGLSSSASNAKAKSVLGWKPKAINHLQGIDQTLLVWRAEGQPEKA